MSYAHNIFISYARLDGSDYAERLYNDLTQRDITAWRDTRDLNPYEDFGGEIELAITNATHVAVIVTPDVRRSDSFARREIAFALEENKPIIPLVFPNGRRPITIINHTYIDFSDWNLGLTALLERLGHGVEEITPQTRREMELVYLQTIGQRYDHWRDLYTDLAATARIEQARVQVKSGAVARYLDMQHDIFRPIEHALEDDKTETDTVQSFDELHEGIRRYERVALIGDPGAGKTTTLERLAHELATEAADDEQKPLPLFVQLGAYDGGDFDTFLDTSFGGLLLRDYLPGRVFLLLDGLNEMQPEHTHQVSGWLHCHEKVPVIVTCRKLDYVGLKLPLQRVDVVPLDVWRIHLFIGNYLEDIDRENLFWGLSGAQTRDVREWFRQLTREDTFDRFWFLDKELGYHQDPEQRQLRAIGQALMKQGKLPGMLGVVSNPFLLFVTIQFYIRSGEMPAKRGQLFDQFVTLLMDQRGKPAARTHPPWIDEQVQRKALAVLAYRMQAERTGTSVEADWAYQVIRAALPSEDAQQLLYLAASASIIEQGKTVQFVHQLLQEFFAAYEMGEDMWRGVPASKYWPGERWWEPTVWDETALLLAGMGDESTPVVRWLTPIHPTLAYRCATESGAPCSEDALQSLYNPLITPMPKYEKGDEIDRWRVSLPRITPLARAEWDRELAERGGGRRGEGLGADCLPDIDWVEIPAGEFIFGDQSENNGPVTLTLPTFYIARYPITFVQFQVFLDSPDGFERDEWWEGLTPYYQKHKISEQSFKYSNHPREQVSWYQAIAYCRWLSAKLDYMVTLPTEQQWEKAARGTTGRSYPWGNEYVPGFANVDETKSTGTGLYFIRRTTAVGMYPQGASPYGVMDMSGNIFEWCRNEYEKPENDTLEGKELRVLRGGAWDDPENGARCVYRENYHPYFRNNDIGFRVVCSAPKP